MDKKPRGFAAMSPEKRREIASKGGKAVAPENRTFSRQPDLAARAGHMGGTSVPPEKRMFSRDPEAAARAGKLGGAAVHKR